MKECLKIRVYEIDGVVETFTQKDPELVSRTLAELHPTRLYTQDRITITDDCSEKTFAPPRITRIDLVTDQLSVWDFHFSLGALSELTESEFAEGIRIYDESPQKRSTSGTAVYLDLQMLDGLRLLLWMQIIAGLPSARLSKICSVLKERRLIFGLRTAGVGVLNLANMVGFSVRPEPLDLVTAQADTELKQRLPHLQSVLVPRVFQ